MIWIIVTWVFNEHCSCKAKHHQPLAFQLNIWCCGGGWPLPAHGVLLLVVIFNFNIKHFGAVDVVVVVAVVVVVVFVQGTDYSRG